MRILILWAFLFITGYFSDASIQEYKVLKKQGREGLIDNLGNEIIPPIYDKIGWSTGEFRVFGELVGYKENGKWGLITLKNKVVQPPAYYKLEIFDQEHLIAAVKGPFSNKLYHGLTDYRGNVMISCNYFNIIKEKEGYVVSVFEGDGIKKGLINSEYKMVISAEFEDIIRINSELIGCKRFNDKWLIFSNSGVQLTKNPIDDYKDVGFGIEVSRNGRKGLLSLTGQEIFPIEYKSVSSSNQSNQFPEWEIRRLNLDSNSNFSCDSLDILGDLFITYTNGNQEVIINTKDLYGDRLVEIKQAKSGFLIAEDQQNNQWSLTTTSGKIISQNQDSIYFDGIYFYAQQDDLWEIYNRFGRKLSPRKFDGVQPHQNNYVPVRKNDYWTLMDFQGRLLTGFKFDSIGSSNDRYVTVSYLNSWGAIDGNGEWKIEPDYEEIVPFSENLIAFRDYHTFVYNKNLNLVHRISARPIILDSLLILKSDSLYGMMTKDCKLVSQQMYDSVKQIENRYFGYLGGFLEMKNNEGDLLLSRNDFVTDVYGFSEEFFKIKKNEKIGFIDENGKLRIANRYDDANLFNEGLAGVELRNNWGVIDKLERIKVQPYYQYISVFREGIAIVENDNQVFGLIDSEGNELIKPEYQSINYKEDQGYLLVSKNGNFGFADKDGKILLRPAYERIETVGNGLLIVTKSGKSGIINIQGYQKVPFDYDQIIVRGDYFFMKKSM